MADIELVVKISEDVYTRLFDNDIQDNEIAVDDICEIARALRLGTPLPKGHGRLIEADSLKEAEQKWSCDYEPDGFSHIVEISDIDEEPTVIEADKEGKE